MTGKRRETDTNESHKYKTKPTQPLNNNKTEDDEQDNELNRNSGHLDGPMEYRSAFGWNFLSRLKRPLYPISTQSTIGFKACKLAALPLGSGPLCYHQMDPNQSTTPSPALTKASGHVLGFLQRGYKLEAVAERYHRP